MRIGLGLPRWNPLIWGSSVHLTVGWNIRMLCDAVASVPPRQGELYWTTGCLWICYIRINGCTGGGYVSSPPSQTIHQSSTLMSDTVEAHCYVVTTGE